MIRQTVVMLSLLALAPLAPSSAQEPTKTANSAVVPVSREGEKWWADRQAAVNERVKKGNADLLYIGDSITQGWEGPGKNVWEKFYASRRAVNLGFSGDRTQHVLWRLDHGNVDGLHPRAAVLMIGTNNSNGNDNTAEEITEGVTAIVKSLRAKLPETKILLLAVFPRGEKPNPQREKIDAVNRNISRLADGQHVYYMDIGPKFLTPDGTLTKEIMPDFLHPNEKGYAIWAEAIESKLRELLGEK